MTVTHRVPWGQLARRAAAEASRLAGELVPDAVTQTAADTREATEAA